MIEQPFLSIGIPTFNRPDGLKRMLYCTTNQTYKNLEIIVSDNCSTNLEVAQVVLQFLDKDKRILFYQQKENIGAIKNFQFVLKKAKGKYFIWLADDDELKDEDYLLKLVNEIQKGFDFVFSNVLKINTIKKKESQNKKTEITLESTTYQKHLEVIKKMFIGYQVVGGVYKTDILKNHVEMFYNSSYYKSYPDEEPFLHFMLINYKWSYLENTFYIKDMTTSSMYKMNFINSFIPNIKNFFSVSRVISKATYTISEKINLIFWKLLRNGYVQITMLVK